MVIETAQKQSNPSFVSLQKKIQDNILRFDLCALLKILKNMGYKSEDIYFKSNPDLASHSSICKEIIFSDEYPRVTLILNIGLLTSNSSLPNFLRKKMDNGAIDPLLFTRFLSFFDHFMITYLLSMSIPEENPWLFANWRETQSQYLNLLALNSISTLWHLFQLCFPELRVEVIKFPRMISMQSAVTTLGSTRLGENSFLGKKDKITISSFKIFLTAEEMENDELILWAVEIKKRLKELLFPLLQRTNIYFQVILIVKNARETARLSHASQLGYRRIGKTQDPLRLLLFSGYSRNEVLFSSHANL